MLFNLGVEFKILNLFGTCYLVIGTWEVLGKAGIGGLFGTVPELLFEKKGLIPNLQRLLVEADNKAH
jgi:hypothetical protein